MRATHRTTEGDAHGRGQLEVGDELGRDPSALEVVETRALNDLEGGALLAAGGRLPKIVEANGLRALVHHSSSSLLA